MRRSPVWPCRHAIPRATAGTSLVWRSSPPSATRPEPLGECRLASSRDGIGYVD
jgi:hypothetical protein